MTKRRRLAVTQRVATTERGERRDCLDQRWIPLLETCGFLPIPLPNVIHDVRETIADLGVDGVILTGGNDLATVPGAVEPAPERDQLEMDILRTAGDQGLPVLGVCRGMQLIAHYYGSRLRRLDGHAGTTHRVVSIGGMPMGFVAQQEVNSFHRYGVDLAGLAGALLPQALAEDGTVEATVHRELPQWGVMWHPERVGAPADIRSFFAALFGSPAR